MWFMNSKPTRPSLTGAVHPVHPFQAMINGVEGDVLYVLAHLHTDETAADIARRCSRSKTQVQEVLYRLHDLGIIDRSFADRWSWNSLNENHPFTQHIRAMAWETFGSQQWD